MHSRTLKKLALALTLWLALYVGALKAQLLGPYSNANASFEVDANGLLSSTGTFGTGSLSISGAGTRMLWYPGKAAFRAGAVAGTEWDDASIGQYSAALGHSNIASGSDSVAFGHNTTASGDDSVATGNGTVASGANSLAMGLNSDATGDYSTAIGDATASGYFSMSIGSGLASGDYSISIGNGIASGNSSTALGLSTTASGRTSTAMGGGTTASGYYSTAMGNGSSAGGEASIAGGNSQAGGDLSFAMGNGAHTTGYASVAVGGGATASGNYATASGYITTAPSFATFVMGRYNVGTCSMGGDTAWNSADPLLELGNGTDGSHLSDAFIVYKNGNVTAQGAVTTTTVKIDSGSNALAGTVTLSSGLATITSSAIDSNTVIVFSRKTSSGSPGVSQPVATVSSGSASVTGSSTDNSTYNWVAMKVN